MSKVFLRYYNFRLPVYLCIELLLISSAVILSCILRFSMSSLAVSRGIDYLPHTLLIAFVCQFCMYYADLYELRVVLSHRVLLIKLIQSLGVATAVLMVIFYVLPPLAVSRGIFMLSIALAFIFLFGWRILYQRLQTLNQFRIRVLIVGTSEEAQKLAGELSGSQALGYEIRGFIGESNEVGKELS